MAPAVDDSNALLTRSFSLPALSFEHDFSLHSLTRPSTVLGEKQASKVASFEIPSFDSGLDLDTSLLSHKLEHPQPSAPERKRGRPHLQIRTDGSTFSLPAASLLSRSKSTSGAAQTRRHADTPVADLEHQLPLSRQKGGPTDALSKLARLSFLSSWSPKSDKSFTSGERRLSATSSATSSPVSITRDEVHNDGPCGTSKADDCSSQEHPKALSKAKLYLTRMAKPKPAVPCDLPMGSSRACEDIRSSSSSPLSFSKRGPGSEDTSTTNSMSWESASEATDDSSADLDPWNKDPLWPSFKMAEADLPIFLAKQTSQRVAQIQQVLLPFLRSTAIHSSTPDLRLEEIDRRASVLSKWWLALLDMLEGPGVSTQHPLTYTDRPCVLEAVTLIMVRPEWRQTTTYYQPLATRSPTERVGSKHKQQTAAHRSPRLDQSPDEHVKTMYHFNLKRQMKFVVEKMTLRHAPNSLVTFAGVSCAYAVFFTPGIADILFRLWGLSHEILRRVAQSLGLPLKDRAESEDIVALFPPHLAPYGWTSPNTVWRDLTKTIKMHVQLAGIPWTGPWLARWKGHDSDLFFTFAKHFNILAAQFIPTGLPMVEKARSPGLAIVWAQMLTIVDSTIHRQAQPPPFFGSASMEGINGPAGAALAMSPVPTASMLRGASQNRLMGLLRDITTSSTEGASAAKETTIETMCCLLKAAASRTLQFDNTACFNLCDLVEESVLTIHDHFLKGLHDAGMGWNFWLGVFKKMLASLHSITEIRVLSAVYAMWPVVSQDPVTKLSWCRDWLLSEDVFTSYFLHWCPMVRAYYQRLLCWRLCRDDGTGSSTDSQIFGLAADRLNSLWSAYVVLKQDNAEKGRQHISTKPVLPSPGKKFIILKQELEVPSPIMFRSFDSFDSLSELNNKKPDAQEDDLSPRDGGKKRRTLLGRVLSKSGLPASEEAADSLDVRPANGSMTGSKSALATPKPSLTTAPNSETRSLAPSPTMFPTKAGREGAAPDFTFRFFLGGNYGNPQEHILTRPRLPGPAQDRLRVDWGCNTIEATTSDAVSGTRAVSASPRVGLVNEAKNANLVATRSVTEGKGGSSQGSFSDLGSMKDMCGSVSASRSSSPFPPKQVNTSHSPKLSGPFARNAVYSGRALAEWTQVVFEYNNFADRRRDEGVLDLCELEVPTLGVEAFRRPGY